MIDLLKFILAVCLPCLSIFIAIGIVFITLKIKEYVSWTWWTVLSPIYVPTVLIIAFWLIMAFILRHTSIV